MLAWKLSNYVLWRKLKDTKTLLRCISTADNSQTHTSSHSTVDADEVKFFSNSSARWWDVTTGEFATLHRMNDLRVPLIRDALMNQTRLSDAVRAASKPLSGCKILDVGCGGGILCEPLARLGGSVTGIDASEEGISAAIAHAKHEDITASNIEYIHGTVEDLVTTREGSFDAVVSSEVVEHVSDVPLFVSSCCKLTKDGGSVIFTTINRTHLSYWVAIVGAEKVVKVLPHGSHSWDKFVTPDELQFEMSKHGCHTRLIHGSVYNPLTRRWFWSTVTDVNYAIHAIKNTDNIH